MPREKNVKTKNKKPWHAQIKVGALHGSFSCTIETPETYAREDAIYDGMAWLAKMQPILPDKVRLVDFIIENENIDMGCCDREEYLYELHFMHLEAQQKKENAFMQKYALQHLKESFAHRKIRLKEEGRRHQRLFH